MAEFINEVSGGSTSAPVAVPAFTANTQALAPEFIRLPTRGRCPWTGLSRPYFYQLIHAGKIKSVSLRPKGSLKGARLIHLASVQAYLRKLMAEQNPG